MTYSPVPVENFGGLNLDADPGEVGWGAAIDLLNVDFDRRGRVHTRNGYSKFNAVAGTNYFEYLVAWDANRQLLAADTAAANTRAYSNAGVLLATDATMQIRTGASLGTGAAGPYFYFSDGANPAHRWDGTTFTTPAAMPSAKCLSVFPTSNRLVAAYTGGATNKSRVQFSDAGAPETWTATSYVDIHPNDGQEIKAMVTWRELIFVFKETKFFIFYGESTDSSGNPIFNYRTVDAGVGCASDYAAVAAEDGVYFICPSGVYRTTGGPAERLPGLDGLFSNGSPFFQSGGTFTTAKRPVAISPKVYFPIGITANIYVGDADPLILVWNITEQKWSAWQMGAFAITSNFAALRLSAIDASPSLLFSYPLTAATKSIGKVVPSATDDDGTSLTSRYRSGFSDLGSTQRKRVREWILEGSGAPTLKTSYDFGSLDTGAAVTLGTSPAVAEARRRFAVRGRQFSWQVGATSAWSVNNVVAHVDEKRAPGTHA